MINHFLKLDSVEPPNLPGLTDAPELQVSAARELWAAAHRSGVALPPPRLTKDGEVLFYARKGRAYLDLGVHGDGTYSFFCRDSQGAEFVSDDNIDVMFGLDDRVCKVLQDLT